MDSIAQLIFGSHLNVQNFYLPAGALKRKRHETRMKREAEINAKHEVMQTDTLYVTFRCSHRTKPLETDPHRLPGKGRAVKKQALGWYAYLEWSEEHTICELGMVFIPEETVVRRVVTERYWMDKKLYKTLFPDLWSPGAAIARAEEETKERKVWEHEGQ